MKSIIQNEKKCYVCPRFMGLHEHHIIYGKNRKNSEQDGLKVYLCYEHHEGTNGVHGKNGHDLDLFLKRVAQKKWLEYYNKTQEEWLEKYKKNYLEEN